MNDDVNCLITKCLMRLADDSCHVTNQRQFEHIDGGRGCPLIPVGHLLLSHASFLPAISVFVVVSFSERPVVK